MKEKTGQKEEKQIVPEERDLDIEQKLTALYALQCVDSAIDKIRTLRGELPLEVQDLEDDIAGYDSKMEKIQAEMAEISKNIADRKAAITDIKAQLKKYDKQLKDVKNSRARYAETVGVPGFDLSPVEESVRLLRESGVDCEFRTTLVRELHRPEDLDDIAVWLEGAPKYFLQNFVDSGNLIGRGYHGFSPEELRAFADRVRPHFGCVALRGVE